MVYRGRASHASSAPELGLNALDGVVQGYTALAMLRQHLRPLAAGARGDRRRRRGRERGARAGRGVVLPARRRHRRPRRPAQPGRGPAWRGPRPPPGPRSRSSRRATSTSRSTPTRGSRRSSRPRARRSAGPTPRPGGGGDHGGSTDFGNVSQLVPGLHADLAVHTWPVVNHQHEFAAACVSETGDRTMLDGAKALALTALAVASDPGVLAREAAGPGGRVSGVQEIEIGRAKRGRRAYSFDDIAIVPSRRTRDPEEVSTAWQIDAYRFEIPVLAAPMDSVMSPATAVEMGRLGGLGVLDLEGLWTRYEDPTELLAEIAGLDDDGRHPADAGDLRRADQARADHRAARARCARRASPSPAPLAAAHQGVRQDRRRRRRRHVRDPRHDGLAPSTCRGRPSR